MDHPSDVSNELQLKSGGGGRPEDHLIDQADDFACFGAGRVVFQEVLEGRDLPTVDGGKVGVELFQDLPWTVSEW
jgi:hypothetical protein